MGKRNTLPRASSPDGLKARKERRVKGFVPEIQKGAHGTTRGHVPGSNNRRKIGR
jgi:hypothetical protein